MVTPGGTWTHPEVTLLYDFMLTCFHQIRVKLVQKERDERLIVSGLSCEIYGTIKSLFEAEDLISGVGETQRGSGCGETGD